jgi:hypothetical protein
MRNEVDLMAGIIASFESASQSLESARLTLKSLLESGVPMMPVTEASCRHRDAIEVQTLGGNGTVWICPDCGDEFA